MYLHASLTGLASILTLQTFIGLGIGIVWGFLVSFMPGVGGNVAIALLLPFIFRLSVPEALAMLLGTHIATYFGGSITSITLNIPASSKSVSLCWDGYPLARKGRGAYALGASATASSVGGVIGAIVLTLGIPVMKALLNVISEPEIFMLAIWGIVIIAIFSSGDLLKGVMAGGLGLILAWVGQSPITGLNRLTFGSDYLSLGIQFATAAMGLFAVAQAIRMLVEDRSGVKRVHAGAEAAEQEAADLPGENTTWSGARAVLHRWRLQLYMSFFGVFTGTVPGLGAPVAAIAAYGQAAQMSKGKHFGTGEIEGVIAPQATDAAAEGGGMLPMLALGIPTHEQQAILLAAFVVLGIAPGPTMLTGHLDVVFTVIWVIVFASLIVGIIGLLTGRYLSKLATLPTHALIPLIVTVALVGSFAVNGRIGDSVMAIVFGLVGYACVKYNYSRVNLIIGLALGPILESNLHITTELYGYGFLLHRPVAAGLGVVVLGTVVWWIISQWRASRSGAERFAAGEDGGVVAAAAGGWSPFIASLAFVAVFAIAGGVAMTYNALTGGIVALVSFACLGLAVLNAVRIGRLTFLELRHRHETPVSVSVPGSAGPTGAGGPDGEGEPEPAQVSSAAAAAGAESTRPTPRVGEPVPAGSDTRARPSGGANLLNLALQRRDERAKSARRDMRTQAVAIGVICSFLVSLLVLGLVVGGGVGVAAYRAAYARGTGWRAWVYPIVWGVISSALVWLLFRTLVSEYPPYMGVL